MDELHASVVHKLLSFVTTAVCVTAPVFVLQASTVQAFPSLILTALWKTPLDEIQPSVVHAFPSSVFTAV